MKHLNKDAARQQWHDRFNNRISAHREPGKVEVNNLATGSAELLIYDEIGYFGVTAKEVVDALSTITAPAINVRINSPGGDVFDGLAIYTALKSHKAKITAQIDGLAASAASFIALAADKIVMNDSALMMVHRAWGLSIGNMDDHLETASILEKIDTQLAGIYAAKTGKSADDVLAMMKGEGKNDGTWFTAEEALNYGLVDEIMVYEEDNSEEDVSALIHEHFRAMRRRLAIAERE